MIYAIIFYLGRNKHKNSFWRTLMYSTKTRRGDYTWNETLSSEQNKAKTPPGVKIDTEACKQKLQFISFPLNKNVFSYKGGNQRSLSWSHSAVFSTRTKHRVSSQTLPLSYNPPFKRLLTSISRFSRAFIYTGQIGCDMLSQKHPVK